MSSKKKIDPSDQPVEFDDLPAQFETRSLATGMPSFAELGAQASAAGELVTAGDGYLRLDREQKRQLVGVPLIIEKFSIMAGVAGDYALVFVVTNRNERFSFTDGGVGITPVLLNVAEGSKVFCRQGLRASEYDGPAGPAITYYLT